MENLRRPAVLAALAAAVLVINLLIVVNRGDDPEVAIDDPIATGSEQDGVGDGATEPTGDAATSGAADDGAAEDTGGAAGDGGGDAADGADDGASDQPAGDGAGAAGLGTPVTGTYTYASGGTWSLTGGAEPEQNQLPATATGTVTADGGAWELRLDAGDSYADVLGFQLGPDGGLDWSTWVLERTFASGPSRTAYSCSGDSAHYRPDEQGRVVTHTCEGPGITSEGRIEHLGSEDVTLGDGTVVSADRLLYSYSVSGDGVSGQGQLDLWLDPGTGLRVREQRTIATTTTSGASTFEYREDVEFTLQALDPA